MFGKKNGDMKAQSAMEYLMTYGWAILIIAVVLAALFELGVFNGSNLAPQACIAQAGFQCTSLIYNSLGISFTFGQTTGQDYYGNYMFIAAEGQGLNASGIPINYSVANSVAVGLPNGAAATAINGGVNGANGGGVLTPGQAVTVMIPASLYNAGNIPPYTAVTYPAAETGLATGTPFAGYLWMGYCLTSACPSPTYFTKVATIVTKSSD